jgi:hypothetical protein
MDMMRRFVAFAFFVMAAQGALAESQRALFTRENRFPETGKAEVGGFYEYREFENSDQATFRPYGRYTIIDDLTLNANVPYHWITDDLTDDDESGIGDAVVGIELLAYEDIFDYPWVIPHIDVSMQTGDEDEGLGTGETVSIFGVSVGTTVYDQLHYIADIAYALNGGSNQEDPEDIIVFAGSIIWDVSEKFAVLAEIRATDEEDPDDDIPYTVQGGMAYAFTEDFNLMWYGGGSTEGDSGEDEDLTITVKGSYSF